MKKKIAILFHKNDIKRNLKKYAIISIAEYWRNYGIKVIFVFGVDRFVHADIAILHVNLSVVPDEYIEFARHYPIVLNGEVKDIRKSSFSRNIVKQNDPYKGKVIIKSDLNHAGRPEWLDGRTASNDCPWCSEPPKPSNYQVFDNLNDVPQSYFKNKEIVIEKFLPEKENSLYFIRNYYFLGDKEICIRLASKNPVVNASTHGSIDMIEPHPKIIKLRRALNFDYGKFDYVIFKGNAVLLDINKTTGAALPSTSQVKSLRRHIADGIYPYFEHVEDSGLARFLNKWLFTKLLIRLM